ncbi:hypothetical protein ACVI1J_010431 [Bradyrhizobium diazoefficiens]
MSIRPTILKHRARNSLPSWDKGGPHSVERRRIDREYNDSPAQ